MTQKSITANQIPELPDDLFNIGSSCFYFCLVGDQRSWQAMPDRIYKVLWSFL